MARMLKARMLRSVEERQITSFRSTRSRENHTFALARSTTSRRSGTRPGLPGCCRRDVKLRQALWAGSDDNHHASEEEGRGGTAGWQTGGDHGGGAGHRACERGALRSGRRARDCHRRERGGALDALELRGRPLDVTDTNAIARLASASGAVDILFNCAGVVHGGTILDCTPRTGTRLRPERHGDVPDDPRLPARHARARPRLDHQHVVGASSVTGVPNRFAYGASKAAVIGLTKSIAVDFVARGIRCNAICPGTVDSPSLQGRMRDAGVGLGRS